MTTTTERICQGCGVDLSDRRKGTLWCEPRCRQLKTTYGIGLGEYNQLLEAQGGRCAICKRHQRIRALAVEHDHRSGLVMGLCCLTCNDQLLRVTRNPALYEAAAEYLRNPPAVKVIGAHVVPRS